MESTAATCSWSLSLRQETGKLFLSPGNGALPSAGRSLSTSSTAAESGRTLLNLAQFSVVTHDSSANTAQLLNKTLQLLECFTTAPIIANAVVPDTCHIGLDLERPLLLLCSASQSLNSVYTYIIYVLFFAR